jgi:lysophospholipase L1-like esterase
MKRPRLHGPLLALATIVALVLLAEAALWLFAPVANPLNRGAHHVNALNPYIRFEYPRRYAVTTEVEPDLGGLQGRHRFSTNNFGFRGDSLATPKPPGEFRIFVVGGSTVECFYLDDDDDVSRVVQRELAAHAPGDTAVKVYGVGLSGTASDDHVAMIAQRLVHLQPDMVVVLAGLNDLRRSIQDFDYLHYTTYGAAHLPFYKRLIMCSQIARRFYYLWQRLEPSPARLLEERRLVSDYARRIALQQSLLPTDAQPRVDAASYGRNLRTIVGLARAHGFVPVFVTHPSTWNSTVDRDARLRHWMRSYDGVVYREDAMDAALEELNDVVRDLGVELGVPMYDLARALPKSLEFFYDDCHFNAKGARAAGRGLAAFLVQQGLAPARADAPSSNLDARQQGGLQ